MATSPSIDCPIIPCVPPSPTPLLVPSPPSPSHLPPSPPSLSHLPPSPPSPIHLPPSPPSSTPPLTPSPPLSPSNSRHLVLSPTTTLSTDAPSHITHQTLSSSLHLDPSPILELPPSPRHEKTHSPIPALTHSPPATTAVLPGASPRLLQLLEGRMEPGDSGNPAVPPNWLDHELFDHGRDFYRRYLFCLSFSELLSLVLMLTMKTMLQPLIHTGRSDTPYKALRRYMSTFVHLITWFKGDVWNPEDPAHKDILAVRRNHDRIARNLNSKDHGKVQSTSVLDKGHEEPSQVLYPAISYDFSVATSARLPELNVDSPLLYLNQLDMSLTQYNFMGLILAHPEKIGAGSATEKDFESLVHFWRGLGWLLGIEDRYNFCCGSVKDIRALSFEVERFFGIPGLVSADWDYEHMTGSLINGIGYVIHTVSFPAMLRFLAYTIDVPVPNVTKRMTFKDCFKYWVMRFVFGGISLVPSILGFLNRWLDAVMEVMKTSPKLKMAAYRKEQGDSLMPQSGCPFK